MGGVAAQCWVRVGIACFTGALQPWRSAKGGGLSAGASGCQGLRRRTGLALTAARLPARSLLLPPQLAVVFASFPGRILGSEVRPRKFK